MTPQTFHRWLHQQPNDTELGDRSWLGNPLANAYADQGQTPPLPMPAWGLNFINRLAYVPRTVPLDSFVCRHALHAALVESKLLTGVA